MTTASDQGDVGSRPSTNCSANTSTGPAACTTRTVNGLASAIPLEVPRAAGRAALGIGAGETLVALLPGSRRSEIGYIAPRLFGAAVEMSRARPGLRFVVPVVPGLRDAVEALRKQHAPDAAITLLDGHAHEALAACDVAIVASGTATLEAALFKRPMVVVYVMHFLSWQMGKLMHYQPWISLPNILLREHAVPELLQGRATPAKTGRFSGPFPTSSASLCRSTVSTSCALQWSRIIRTSASTASSTGSGARPSSTPRRQGRSAMRSRTST